MRESGILMHITSLPGPYGIGTLGKEAFGFVDFLAAAGQRYWQLLPLNPTSFGDSPYQAVSSAAGNPYLIDLDTLASEGLLTRQELESVRWCDREDRVNYGILYRQRYRILRLAYGRFRPGADYEAFCQENRDWLPDYCLFMAMKEKNGGAPWTQWPREEKLRCPEVLSQRRRELAEEIGFHSFLQYLFFRQWQALRQYAGERGIQFIGDVPIYVPLDSVDVWREPQLFQLDEEGLPTVVAGCPPDAFTADGQLWGNPIYNWEAMEKEGFSWWLRRLKSAAGMYDVVRLDHFRGLESYWQVPAGEKTARDGTWVQGPGLAMVRALQQGLPSLRFIAEDLGYITPGVQELLAESGYPGMKVLQFAFDSREESDYLPHLYVPNSVCYTGTHDNPPLAQWLEEASEKDLAMARAYLGLNSEEGCVWGLLRGGMASVSRLFLAQIQDYLELGKEARMNVPGLLSPENWSWRAQPGFDSPALAARIRAMTALYGRLPG